MAFSSRPFRAGLSVFALSCLVACADSGRDAEREDSSDGEGVDAADAADAASDPYADWPEPTAVFPWVFTPDPDKPTYADARWETEDWDIGDPQVVDYLQKLQAHYTTASPEVQEHFEVTGAEIPPLGEGIVLSFSGDILWVGDNWSSFAEAAAPITQADLRIGNLETAASSLHDVQKTGIPVRFNSAPEMLDHLPFDVLQLNNNHTLDMDDDGAESTKAECEKRGIATTGLDTHATVEVKGKKIALLSYTWGVNRRDYESAHELFIVPFGHIGESIDVSVIESHIADSRAAGADFVVVLLHWGFEFEWYPEPHFLQLARQIVAYGADVIAGQGPHVVQPAEICWVNHPDKIPGVGTCSVRSADGRPRRAAVLYSLGNFTNDAPDRIEVETGIVAKVSLDGDVTGLGWTPVVLRHDPPRVEPADAHIGDPKVKEELDRLDAHLGAGWRIQAPTAADPKREAILSVGEKESWALAGLTGDAYVVRTEADVPHIYAKNRNDLGRVLGFTLARDRYFFMELQRRYSLGTISELLGDAGLPSDMNARLTGVSMVAERLTQSARGEMKEYLESFVAGVNAYIDAVKAGDLPGPSELDLAGSFLGAEDPAELMQPFALRDVMAIAAALLFETNFRADDVARAAKRAALGGAFAGADMAALREAGFLGDVWGTFRPLAPGNASAPGFGTSGLDKVTAAIAVPAPVEPHLLARIEAKVRHLQSGLTHDAFGAYGSNAWAVAGQHTETGGALVAGDGHLALTVPSLMFQVGLDTEALGGGEIHQLGLFLTPFPILGAGTNGRVAWSMVNPVVDITDWYHEQLQLDGGLPVASKFDGEWKPLEVFEEKYEIADVPALGSIGRTETWARYETFDGRRLLDVEGTPVPDGEAPTDPVVHVGAARIVPGDVNGDGVVSAVSFDFGAFDATLWPEALYGMGVSGDVLEFREATRGVVGGGLFMVAGDVSGNVLYSSYQALPCRENLPREGDTFAEGAHPAYLLDGTQFGGFSLPTDGDGKADEAAGELDPSKCLIPFEVMPQSLNPPEGFVRTANNQPAPIDDDGDSANDAWYLGGPWESVRADTIRRRLEQVVAAGQASIEDMASVQADRTSRLGEMFTSALLAAIDRGAQLAGAEEVELAHEVRIAALYDAHAARLEQVRARLGAWTFDAPSGVETFYESPTQAERADAVAAMIFNAWLPRFVELVWGDEPCNELFPFRPDYTRLAALLTFLDGRGASNPAALASFDAELEESIFFDRNGTPEREVSDELILLALVDALDFLESPPSAPGVGGLGTADPAAWLWGLRHQVRFDSLLSQVGDDPALALIVSLFSITTAKLPLAEGMEPGDPRKNLIHFPRGGDNFSVDAAEQGFSPTSFTYAHGPAMRMVVSLGETTTGQNIIPGGQSGLVDSPHFSDQAELWLGNEALPMRFDLDDVVEGATGRETFRPAP